MKNCLDNGGVNVNSNNTWKELMDKKVYFQRSMNDIIDTYQHETGKIELDMKDIDDLVSLIKYELYRKHNIITEEQFENLFR